MAEFDEVGRTVENFASEDATIVIGTVLDPDMQDDVRVTVVATGLNRAQARGVVRDSGYGRDTHHEAPRRPQVHLINSNTHSGRRDGTTGMFIDEGDAPAPVVGGLGGLGLRRGSAEPAPAPATPAVADFGGDAGYLDIPAFLRRQAD